MSNIQEPPQPAAQPPVRRRLFKQNSWSPDSEREQVWRRRKLSYLSGLQRRRGGEGGGHQYDSSKSVTDEDLDEIKGCIELGFAFEPDSPIFCPKLPETFPALEFFCEVQKRVDPQTGLSRTTSSSSMIFDTDDSTLSSSPPMFGLRHEDPETLKARLKQWARAVACTALQMSDKPVGG